MVPRCAVVLVVVDDERALAAEAVGVGEDVFVDVAIAVPEVVEGEVGAAGEDVALLEQRSDLALVAGDQVFVGPLLHLGLLELHAVALGEAFDLAVAEHGQPGQGGEQGADAEVFVAGAELVDSGALVGVGHEVDVALHNVGIELDGLLEVAAVLGVLLVAQHVHEGGVVDAMHAEGADEVAFEQPEGLGEEQGAGDLGGDAVDDLAPELVRHEARRTLPATWSFPHARGWNRRRRAGETRGAGRGVLPAPLRHRSE